MEHSPQDSEFAARVEASFARQRIMPTLGARLTRVEPGRIEIVAPYSDSLSQQHGYFHAGLTTTLMDSSCGYAAMTLTPAEGDCLTIEFKANFVRPAEGTLLIARGHVITAGKSITVCQSEAFVERDGREHHVAVMLATIRTFVPRT